MSHVDLEIVSSVPADIDSEYGNIEKLPSRGVKYKNTFGLPLTDHHQAK